MLGIFQEGTYKSVDADNGTRRPLCFIHRWRDGSAPARERRISALERFRLSGQECRLSSLGIVRGHVEKIAAGACNSGTRTALTTDADRGRLHQSSLRIRMDTASQKLLGESAQSALPKEKRIVLYIAAASLGAASVTVVRTAFSRRNVLPGTCARPIAWGGTLTIAAHVGLQDITETLLGIGRWGATVAIWRACVVMAHRQDGAWKWDGALAPATAEIACGGANLSGGGMSGGQDNVFEI